MQVRSNKAIEGGEKDEDEEEQQHHHGKEEEEAEDQVSESDELVQLFSEEDEVPKNSMKTSTKMVFFCRSILNRGELSGEDVL